MVVEVHGSSAAKTHMPAPMRRGNALAATSRRMVHANETSKNEIDPEQEPVIEEAARRV